MLFRKKIKPQFMITIPEPCSEDWEKMHVVDDEHRHCDSCARTLTDFTNMSDDELVLFFKYNNKKLCGRFHSDQLNRSLRSIQEKTSRSTWWKAVVTIPLALFSRHAFAQQNDSIISVDSMKIVRADSTITDTIPPEEIVVDSIPSEPDCTITTSHKSPGEQSTIVTIMTGDVTTSVGCVVPTAPVVVGWIPGRPEFKPTLYDPLGLEVLFAPDPESPDTLQRTGTTNLTEKNPGAKSEEPRSPATATPWYEAILPSSLRIRRKG